MALYRYLLDDFQPYIFRTEDYGQTWTRLTTGTNGIPADHPTRAVREDPDREGLLYAGTEFGLFISFDDGAHWQSFQQNLPVTPVTDIKVFRQDLVLSTMGRSFWVMDDITPLHELSEDIAAAPAYLFQPRNAFRVHSSRGFGESNQGPQYPQAGVRIDYHLSTAPTHPVTLEILDADGTLIRAFSSDGADVGTTIPAEPEMGGIELARLGTARISAESGMHRIMWDMRHAGPWDATPRAAGRRGPIVAPGRYQARLSLGSGFSQAVSFDLAIDPRVAADGETQADLEAQTAFNLEVRDFTSEAKMTLHRIESLLEQVEASTNAAGDRHAIAATAATVKEKLTDLRALFVTAEGRYQTPMLISQIGYLNGMTNRADQRPGNFAYSRLAQLRDRFAGYVADMRSIESGDLADLNRQLRAEGLEPIGPGQH